MKYIDEYRDGELARRLSSQIHAACSKPWTIMEVCGGQTHTILQFGIEDLLPSAINLVHGPGCPICVTPIVLVDQAIQIAQQADVIFCSFGDMLRVPGNSIDLMEARARGADVRIVYSPLDALTIARKNPHKNVVFFAVGFETTAPANAMSAYQAKLLGVQNFFMLLSHVTVPPVCETILRMPDNKVQAFIGPGHVCTITGLNQYEKLAAAFEAPIVVAGFEPVDILEALLMCVRQLEAGQHEVQNQYRRVVEASGNLVAQKILDEVFQLCDREWRGLGMIPDSGFEFTDEYSHLDALRKFNPESPEPDVELSDCISGEILMGNKKPTDCPAFGRRCTPESPLGATMVSAEGTCANYYKFKLN